MTDLPNNNFTILLASQGTGQVDLNAISFEDIYGFLSENYDRAKGSDVGDLLRKKLLGMTHEDFRALGLNGYDNHIKAKKLDSLNTCLSQYNMSNILKDENGHEQALRRLNTELAPFFKNPPSSAKPDALKNG